MTVMFDPGCLTHFRSPRCVDGSSVGKRINATLAVKELIVGNFKAVRPSGSSPSKVREFFQTTQALDHRFLAQVM